MICDTSTTVKTQYEQYIMAPLWGPSVARETCKVSDKNIYRLTMNDLDGSIDLFSRQLWLVIVVGFTGCSLDQWYWVKS